MTMTDLAEAIQRDRSTVTTLVRNLVQQEFIELHEKPSGFRSRLVSLTPKGKNLHREFLAISEKLMQITWQGITEEEREQFRCSLDTIIQNFQTILRKGKNEEI